MIEVVIYRDGSFTESDYDFDEIIRTVTDTARLSLKMCAKHASVSVMLTGDSAIRDMNREYRNVDSTTDVLSFPALEAEGGSIQVQDAYIGDIAISLERALKQAEEYGHSFMREIAFLTAHGTLHLLGYDHMTAEDESRMLELQKQILSEMRLTR